jgi:2-polyprenyl-6-methoxyphenol hydroxylase-like FAD-dependent oxidoreductase
VEFEDKKTNEKETEDFDIVVGADGIKSRTREAIMGSPAELGCFKSVGCFVAFFSIPKEEQDWPRSRLCQFSGRRTILLRPRGEKSQSSSAYLARLSEDDISLREAAISGDKQMQKEALAEVFSGLGWEIPRVLEKMMTAVNFYFEQQMQVKLSKWFEDRVVLLGDAAYGPSPLTGQGTLLAILGAYVLAQEMSRHLDAPQSGFSSYEQRLRAYVESSQSIPLGGYLPFIVNPQTSWGIWLFRKVAGFISWTGLSKVLPEPKAAPFDLQIQANETR